MAWLNPRRLRDYPRLIGASFWAVLAANLLTHKGWFGGFGGIISFDFLTMVAAARLYWADIGNLYNFETLFQVERQIFWPTPLEGGGNIFTYPPYVAVPYSIFLGMPYSWAFILWTVLSLAAIAAAVVMLSRDVIPQEIKQAGLSTPQMLVLTFSFFPILFGLFQGQNNGLSLFLAVCVLVFTLKEKWYLAGVCAGLMLYKPHFCIAFVLLWLVWKKFKAVAAFGVVALLWGASVLLTYGLEPYFQYLHVLPELMYLPYGIGRYVEVTLFSLIATSLPLDYLPGLLKGLQILFIVATLGLGWLAFRVRRLPLEDRIPVLMLALLYPFLVSPHTLNHDMVLLIPVLALWTRITSSRYLLYGTIVVYLGSFLLLLLTRPTGLALLALIPIGMAAAILAQIVHGGNLIFQRLR